MTAFKYLKWIRDEQNFLPLSREQPCTEPSNAELKRWLKKKSILINGKTPNVNDEIEIPVWELVFFYKSGSKCTIW